MKTDINKGGHNTYGLHSIRISLEYTTRTDFIQFV